ncbi:NAD(P)-binding protein [Laetiporus sulphureus 93-53]|uniref:NAD(P)-binding protein n=1 Tax=Laetiporus sulphureus 93-53 TaxID=1314785 RepID=A0A165DEU9_9APHY|nr:NAD(P)-binding protein [Laetiporus sulphureus 93-53]KZT04733.1 NAD(P)-binding protein [Laetiporus sulphureus 93-53]
MPSYVITGASRGIGLEFVRQLSTSADNVVFGLVRNKATATKLFDLARDAPHSNVHILQADVLDLKALKAAAEEVSKVTGGSLDYLINNAAYLEVERRNLLLDEYPADLVDKDIVDSIRVNVVGVIHTTNAFLPLLRVSSAQPAKVISLGSGLSDPDFTVSTGFASSAPYAISKAALVLTIAKYAAEYKDQNVAFITISPGLVDTRGAQPTPELIREYEIISEKIKNVYPDWEGKPLTPEQSVRMMLKVLSGLGMQDTGAFISHFGNKKWV